MGKNLLLLSVCIFGSFTAGIARNDNNIEQKKLQFGFIENKGQIINQENKQVKEVLYLLNTPGLNIQLRKGGFSYDTYIIEGGKESLKPATVTNQNVPSAEYKFHRVDITLEGANANCDIIAENAASDYINYYTTGIEKGALNVQHYGKLIYKNIYPGIDLEFAAMASDSKPVEYNFIVHPGADASQIKLRYAGAENTSLVNNAINIKVQQGSFTEAIPASYIAGTNEPVNVTYALMGENTYGYAVPAYDKSKTLIIDPTPVLAYASYYGGSSGESSYGMSVNGSFMYLGGLTLSSNNIATTGAYQTSYYAKQDCFTAKFSLAGKLIWGTYYGNSENDACLSIASTSNGDVFIGGQTESTSGFATSGVAQTGHGSTFNSTYDGFIAKFNSSGARQWSTYVGFEGFETVYSLAIDNTGDVAFSGVTSSANLSISGAQQSGLAGVADATVGYLEGAAATGFYFLTNLGADNLDEAHGVAVDASYNVYVTGIAFQPSSQQFIATIGCHQPYHGGGSTDMFLAKYNVNGALQWGTYYGGTNNESYYNNQTYPATQKLTIDGSSNIYIAGSSFSTGSSIGTIGSSSGGEEGFIAKFNTNGVRQWSKFIGTSSDESIESVLLDGSGNIYAVGNTNSSSGLATSNAYQKTNNGSGTCMFAIKLNGSGTTQWCTYVGGNSQEDGYGLGIDSKNAVYVSGHTLSSSGLATTGAQQTSIGGTEDAFFAKLIDCSGANITGTATQTPACTGQSNGSLTVTASGGTSPYQYQLGTGTFQSSNTFNSLASGAYTITIKDADGCDGSFNTTVSQVPSVTAPVITGSVTAMEFTNKQYSTAQQTGATYNWTVTGGTISKGQGTDTIDVAWGAKGTGTVKVVVSQGAPCEDSSNISVSLTPNSVKDVMFDNNVMVFPNPVKDRLTIKMESVPEGIEIKLFDSQGRLVINHPAQKEQVIDISSLPAGIYHLNIGKLHKNISKL